MRQRILHNWKIISRKSKFSHRRGSTASIISCHIFQRFSNDVKSFITDTTSDIRDVNGNAIENNGSLVLIVSFGDEKFPQKFIVCKIAQDGILGQDFLLTYIKKINYQRMVLHTCRGTEIQSYIPGNANLQCRLLTSSRVTLPTLSGLKVPIEIPSAELLTKSGHIVENSFFSD